MFGKKRRVLERQQREYYECESIWYFDVEYYEDIDIHPHHMKFNSLQDAEYWVKHSGCVSCVCVVTDRMGNRIITDWSGYTGAGTIKLWTETMGRSVLDVRTGHNELWVPSTDKRAKNAHKRVC